MSGRFRPSGIAHSPPPTIPYPLAVGSLAVLLGGGIGVAVVLGSPTVAIAVVGGLVMAAAVAASLQAGLIILVAVVSLLPFAVIPVRVGVQLTVVDALLGALLVGWLTRAAAARGTRGDLAPPPWLPLAGRPLLLFLGVAMAALLATSAPLSGPTLRAFLKYTAAILLMLAVANVVRTRAQIRRLIRALILCGALAGALALLIQALPRPTIVSLLSSLSVVGYPAGPEVLRFLPAANNTYSDTLRATGTSIDPNVLGGLLMLAAALMLAQWFAPRPVVPRWGLVPLIAVSVVAMVATYSRSSWVGLAIAAAFLATGSYRKLWLLAIPATLTLLYLPVGQEMLERLASGFGARDRAAALRLDEYRQALRLIADHPLLGVGFGGAPEAGTFVGVSSIYLLVGEQTGLLGLGLYLTTLAVLLVTSLRVRVRANPDDRALVATLQASLVAALTAGLFDHYFMNPQFPHMVALFWLLAGLLVVATRLAGEPIPTPFERGST